MPSYLYFCEDCQKEFEEIHSITIELQECPVCTANGKEPHKPKRLISLSSFVLLGGGWAKDHYK